MFTISYRYTYALMRRLYLSELWRTQGGWLISSLLLLAGGVWASLNPQYFWFGGFLAGVSLTYLWLLYTNLRSEQRLRAERDVTVTITDAGLHLAFATVTTDLPWNAIAVVRRTRNGLILNPRYGGRPLMIPSERLPDEAQQFMIRAVIAAGGRASDGA
jgi:hypothetical protein